MDIILQFPKSAIYFFRFTRKWVNKAVCRHMVAMVLGMILLRGNRTLGKIAVYAIMPHGYVPWVLHEFGHTFVNPITDEFRDEIDQYHNP